jgi:NCS1 family nucleobase:cation symporter-1
MASPPPFPALAFEENLKKTMLSPSRLLALIRPSTWKLEPEQSTFASNSAWSNQDMDPVPPHLQTWTTLSYTTFWISCVANVTVWELASSMIAVGLSWYDLHPAH